MYDQLEHTITSVNEISELILKELKAKEPRLDYLKNEFKNRKVYLLRLDVIKTEQEQNKAALDIDKMEVLRPLFDLFASINKEIVSKMAALKERQFERVASARKQRKVQKSYVTAPTPNIHHF